MVSFGNVKWLVKFTSANLCHASRRGVWFHVLCGVLRRHSRCRGEDNSPLRKGNLCDYVNRAWLFKFLCLLLKCFDSLQVCLFYRRKGVVEPVGNSDKSLCVEWLFGISELPHFRQVLQYVSFVRIIFVHNIHILRFLLFLFVHQL